MGLSGSIASPAHQSAVAIPGLAVRSRAAELLYDVVEAHQPLEGAFDEAPSEEHAHASSDRALIQALVMASLRHLPTLDAAINACLERPLSASAGRVLATLRIMAAQLLVLQMPAHAAVTLAVEDVGKISDTRKFKGLVNAVGRRMARDGQSLLDDAPASNLPGWLHQRWTDTYGRKRAAKIAAALLDQPAIDLTLKPDVPLQAMLEQLADHGATQIHRTSIRLQKPGAIAKLPGFEEGHWWVQDVAASLPAKILLDALDKPEGARVLDLCAAPGGKTAQLAAAGADVTALDQSAQRMQRLQENMTRLGLTVTQRIGDALTYQPDAPYDAVLLDAPCSATGTLRRNPDIAYVRQPGDIKSIATLQARILRAAAQMVKPGGVLVYATCSLEPEEGSDQITQFLAETSQWSLDPIDPASVPQSTRMPDGTLRTLPSMHPLKSDPSLQAGMDGFYTARLRKHA